MVPADWGWGRSTEADVADKPTKAVKAEAYEANDAEADEADEAIVADEIVASVIHEIAAADEVIVIDKPETKPTKPRPMKLRPSPMLPMS